MAAAWLAGCAESRGEGDGGGGGGGGREALAGASAGSGDGAAGDRAGSAGGDAGRASDGPFVLGCRREPLVLGEVRDPDLEAVAPQLVWTGRDFAVGWPAPDGYRIAITNGQSISNQRTLDATPSAPSPVTPQLFWSRGRLELYYPLSGAIYADALDSALALIETRMIGYGRFRAVPISADEIAVLTAEALYVDGVESARPYSDVGPVGWNGDYLLVSAVLGHGAWTLSAFELDGSRRVGNVDPSLARQWCGVCGASGSTGGSAFASSAEAHRHALIIAAERKLTVAVEGRSAYVRELAPDEPGAAPLDAEAALLWDGERYVALLADRGDAPAAAGRDLTLIPVTLAGRDALQAHAQLTVSSDPADERFPVAAAAGPGDYAIAWVRAEQLVVQRCALSQR